MYIYGRKLNAIPTKTLKKYLKSLQEEIDFRENKKQMEKEIDEKYEQKIADAKSLCTPMRKYGDDKKEQDSIEAHDDPYVALSNKKKAKDVSKRYNNIDFYEDGIVGRLRALKFDVEELLGSDIMIEIDNVKGGVTPEQLYKWIIKDYKDIKAEEDFLNEDK